MCSDVREQENNLPDRTSGQSFRKAFPPRLGGGWLLLFLLWMMFSAKFDLFHLGTGVVVVTLVVWQHSLLPSVAWPGEPSLRPFAALLYVPWLIWQMFKSAIYVAVVILHHPRKIDPQILAFRCNQPSTLQQVFFANSITLTPGTLTLELEEDRYLVHCLTEDTAQELLSGSMAQKVGQLSNSSESIVLSQTEEKEKET